MKYAYKSHVKDRISRKPAKIVVERLTLLNDRYGGLLTPKQVVTDARDRRSPLHSYFEWNNTKAAELYRLEQARRLIRSVVLVADDSGKKLPPARVFVHVFAKEEEEDGETAGGYVRTLHALSTEAGRKAVLQSALRDIRIFREKYETLKELAGLMKSLRGYAERLEKVIKKVSRKKKKRRAAKR